jgi:predicted nucleotidyltransferase
MLKSSTTQKLASLPSKRYRGPDVTIAVIRRYARQIVERFQPDRIVLFGSHAYGTPHADSDVDLLVVMAARNQHDLSVKIRWELPAPFPMDLLVRTPASLRWRLAEGDSFLKEIMTEGKVLDEKDDERVDSKGRSRLRHGPRARPHRRAPARWRQLP